MIRDLRRIPEEDIQANEWLRNVAGWDQADVEFYNLSAAIPADGGVYEWIALRPSEFAEFRTLLEEALLSGVSAHTLLVRRCGLENWDSSMRNADHDYKARRGMALVNAVRNVSVKRMLIVAFRLETGDFHQAKDALEGGDAVDTDW